MTGKRTIRMTVAALSCGAWALCALAGIVFVVLATIRPGLPWAADTGAIALFAVISLAIAVRIWLASAAKPAEVDFPEWHTEGVENRDFNPPCRFCGLPGSFLITQIENGNPTTFSLCRDHAAEKGPHSEGILPLVCCPECDGKMSIESRKFGFVASCAYYGHTQPYKPVGT